MKSESIKAYTRRIASANKGGIIVIIYDIIEENLSLAEEALEKGEKEAAREAILCARVFLKELLTSLDMKYEISIGLADLYIYVNRCLNFALLNGNIVEIRTAKSIMEKLGLSFREVAKSDFSAPMMENTEQVFSGFTYGKDFGLSETKVDGNEMNRGFRV